MNVITAIPAAPDTTGGGIRAGIQLSQALKAKDGVTLRIYKMEASNEALFDYGDLRPRYLPPKERLASTLSTLAPVPDRYSNPFIGCKLTNQFKQEEPDIVHIHNSLPVRGMNQIINYANAQDTPIVFTAHGLNDKFGFPDHAELSFPGRLIYKLSVLQLYVRALNKLDAIIALTESDQTFLRELIDSIPIYLSSNGVFERVYSEDPDRYLLRKYDLAKPLILFVGSITDRKGVKHLISISNKIDKGTLAIVGPTKTKSALEDLSSKLCTEHAKVLGYIPDQELYDLYALSDLFVLPTQQDTFPLVLLEAMMNQTPIVATNSGAIPRQIGNSGIAVEDPENIPPLVNDLIQDQSKLEHMGDVARQRVTENFSWKSVADEHLSIYEEVISVHSRFERAQCCSVEP